MIRFAMLSLFLVLLSACEGVGGPRGIGGGTDDFERSPCACDEPFYQGGQWIS